MSYAELAVTTNFTFLTGASHPEEMIERAAALGLDAIAIADRNTLAGVVRAWTRLKELRKEAEAAYPEAESFKRRSKSVTNADLRARAKAIRVRKDPSGRREVPNPPEVHAESDFVPRSIPKLIVGARLVLEEDPQRDVEATEGSERESPQEKTPRDVEATGGSGRESPQEKIEWLALPADRAAYGRLCRLLSIGKRRAEKGQCRLTRRDLENWGEGMILLGCVEFSSLPRMHRSAERCDADPGPRAALRGPGSAQRHFMPQRIRDSVATDVAALARRFPGQVFTAAAPRYDGEDAQRFAALARLAEKTGAPMVAVSDALMHRARRRRLADVLTCIREGCTIDTIGTSALPNAERRLRSEGEMRRLFRDYPEAVDRTAEIAARCQFDLSELKYEYPDEVLDGEEAQPRLTRLTEDGLRWRYPEGTPADVCATIAKELRLIEKLDYARYFLTVRDIVAFARSKGILCQGRGSAANSVVCYALGITEADPTLISAVFERFVSEARGEPPDIDVDFEHERREEVIQHIYQRYGRHRAGLCATVIHFRARAAMREVGKAMGLLADMVSALAGQVWGWSSKGIPEARIRELGLDPADRRLRQTMELVHEIIGFPRHLSQHVGGFIITRERLDEVAAIENAAMEDRTVIEWDKDDVEALGMLKVDVLGLGMLTCLRKGLDLLREHGGPDHTLDSLPKEDDSVYDMLCEGDSLGVFQVESRAQMNFLPRMKPRNFYDLVIEVAIVRPGPIQGDMVHPYLRRRNGEEEVDYVKPELEAILGKTLGVPLFQEQAMQIAMVAAEFTPDEADGLRRAMATFRRTGTIQNYRDLFIGRMVARGYPPDFAERCFRQIEGFGEYGFPESHAASFALLVYASSWLKKHHPAVFACALLNSQPMGFYAPAQIVRDAREHGVEVRPVCVNASEWDCTLEPAEPPAPLPRMLRSAQRCDTDPGPRKTLRDPVSLRARDCASMPLALRLGFRQIKGLKETDAVRIALARGNGYADIESVWHQAGVPPRMLTRLAEADAFAALGLNRREALWQAKAIRSTRPLPLFAGDIDGEGIAEPPVMLPAATDGEEVVADYVTTRLTLRAHPMALLRPMIEADMAQGRLQ